jgi:hypothetical protein
VSARADSIEMPGRPITAARAEHISLESTQDVISTPLRHPHRKTLSSFKMTSALRGSETELALLEDHYLSVRIQQPGQDIKKYTLDLRFANPRPVIVRHIAWALLGTSVVASVAAIASFWWAVHASSAGLHPGVFIGLASVITVGLSVWQFLRRTTESLQFTSVHGAVTLVRFTGGIGSAKAGRHFFVEVIKSISAAKTARAQAKQQFLRDEMREHHRLRELRVLTEHEYEASKARILAAHS